MRAVWFIAWRMVARMRSRTVFAALLALAVIAVSSAALVLFEGITTSSAQNAAASLMSADLSIDYGTLPAAGDANSKALSAVRQTLTKRYGSATRFSDEIFASGVDVRRAGRSGATAGTAATAAGAGTVNLTEFDSAALDAGTAYDLVTGRFPKAACQADVSAPLVRQLGVGVGDPLSIALSTAPVTVVGVVQSKVSHSSSEILVAPGTWSSCIAGAPGVSGIPSIALQEMVTVPASAQAKFTADFSGSGGGGDQSAIEGELSKAGASVSASRAVYAAFQPFWLEHPIDFSAPVLALLAAAALGQIAVRMRRDAHLIGSLQALGVRGVRAAGIATLAYLIPTVCGAIVGLAIGIPAAIVATPWFSDLADHDPSTNPVPLAAILGGAGVFVAISAVGTVAIAFAFTRRESLAAESIHFSERVIVPRSPRAASIVAVVLFCLVMTSWLLLPGAGAFGLVRAALLCALLVALAPLASHLLRRWISPCPLLPWLAVRMAHAEVGRVIGIVSVVGFGLAAPLGLLMLQSSYVAEAYANYTPSIPSKQVIVMARSPISASAMQKLRDAAGVAPAVQPLAESPQGSEAYAAPADAATDDPLRRAQITVVTGRAEAAVVLGWKMPDADWAAVSSGSALWIHESARPARVTVVAGGADSTTVDLGELPAVTSTGNPPATALHDGGAVITEQTAQKLGLKLQPLWIRFPHSAAAFDTISATAAQLGVASSDVLEDEGPYVPPAPVSYDIALTAAALLVGIGVFLVIAPTGRESRGTNGTLLSIGVRRKTVVLAHSAVSLSALLTGLVIGIAAGLGVFLAQFVVVGAGRLVVPWPQIGLAAGTVLVIGAAAAAVGTAGRMRSAVEL